MYMGHSFTTHVAVRFLHVHIHQLFLLYYIQKRLQILSAAGIPISVSELSIHANTVSKRAEILEKVLYALYSEPLVCD